MKNEGKVMLMNKTDLNEIESSLEQLVNSEVIKEVCPTVVFDWMKSSLENIKTSKLEAEAKPREIKLSWTEIGE